MTDFPKLALGTWLMGGTKEADPENDDSADIAIIRLAIENGISLIDTAQNYANGKCEELVGAAIKPLTRTSYQILTKQRKERLGYDHVIADCHASLERLQCGTIDYFVCHAPYADVDPTDFFRATNELIKQGKVAHVGVSNFGPNMLKIAVETSETPIVVNQVHFALDDDDVLTSGTYDFCREHNIAVQAYRSLVDLDTNESAVSVLDEIASTRQLTRQQVAIAYLHSYEGVSFTIRASSQQHWQAIKDALDTRLNTEEVKLLRATHRGIVGRYRHFLEL